MKAIAALFALFMWISGIVIAKGFWLTTAAIFIPFVSWYLVIEKVLTAYGII